MSNQDKIAKLEKKLRETVDEIFQLSIDGKGRLINLIHPYVLVRVLEKESRTASGLYLPGNIQNKPVYEGIVLATWAPYTETRKKKLPDGTVEEISIERKCVVKVGDRVFFPHYEGRALEGYLNDKYYRIIREGADQAAWPWMSVLGTLNYEGDVELAEELSRVSAKFFSRTTSGTDPRPGTPHWEPPAGRSMFSS